MAKRGSKKDTDSKLPEVSTPTPMPQVKDPKPEPVEEEKEEPSEKFRCCFCGHKSVLVAGVTVGDGFVLTEVHKSNAKFMKPFNRAIETKVICPL